MGSLIASPLANCGRHVASVALLFLVLLAGCGAHDEGGRLVFLEVDAANPNTLTSPLPAPSVAQSLKISIEHLVLIPCATDGVSPLSWAHGDSTATQIDVAPGWTELLGDDHATGVFEVPPVEFCEAKIRIAPSAQGPSIWFSDETEREVRSSFVLEYAVLLDDPWTRQAPIAGAPDDLHLTIALDSAAFSEAVQAMAAQEDPALAVAHGLSTTLYFR